LDSTSETCCELLEAANEIEPLRVHIDHPTLQVAQTGPTDPLTIVEGPKVGDVQLHRQNLRLEPPVGASQVAHAAMPGSAIQGASVRHEARSVAGEQNAAEVFAIVVQ